MSAAIGRLYRYHEGFSRETLYAVDNVAERQQAMFSYGEFFDSVGITKPEPRSYDGYKPISVLDIRPKEHDPSEAVFVRLAMGNDLDPNQMFQVGTIAASNPDKRVVAFANPSGLGRRAGRLSLMQALSDQDGAAFVAPYYKYAEEEGIETVHEVGYSWGAWLAMRSAQTASYAVRNLVTMEPVIGNRSLPELGKDFKSTDKHLEHYVEQSGLPIFEMARADSVGDSSYILGLLRVSNITAALQLRDPNYLLRAAKYLATHPEGTLTAAWGTDSELTNDAEMRRSLAFLRNLPTIADRVQSLRFVAGRHAMFNDIHLQAATVRHALTNAA